jgi:hypothetical protein
MMVQPRRLSEIRLYQEQGFPDEFPGISGANSLLLRKSIDGAAKSQCPMMCVWQQWAVWIILPRERLN